MNHLSVDEKFSMRTPKVTKKFRFLYNKVSSTVTAQSLVFMIDFRFLSAPYRVNLHVAYTRCPVSTLGDRNHTFGRSGVSGCRELMGT